MFQVVIVRRMHDARADSGQVAPDFLRLQLIYPETTRDLLAGTREN